MGHPCRDTFPWQQRQSMERIQTCSAEAPADAEAEAALGFSLVNSSEVANPLLRPWPGHVGCCDEKDAL